MTRTMALEWPFAVHNDIDDSSVSDDDDIVAESVKLQNAP